MLHPGAPLHQLPRAYRVNKVSALLLRLAGSSRKQGEYLSRVIKAVYAGEMEMKAGNDLETLRLSFSCAAYLMMAQPAPPVRPAHWERLRE